MMLFRKILSNFRAECESDGSSIRYDLSPHTGGHTAKVAMYQIVIVQKSSESAQLALDLDHGPDGRNFVPHSAVISTTTLSGGSAKLVSGQADTSKVLGEWLRPSLVASGASAAGEWVVVDVYEMLKPF